MPKKKKSEDNAVDKEDVKKSSEEPGKKKKQKSVQHDEIPTVEAEVVKKPKRGYGNNGNLRSIGDLPPEERRAIQARGARGATEAKKRKKELREFTKDFLMQAAAPALQSNMKLLGVEDDDRSNLAAMVVRLFSKAVNNGDLNAARTLIEWAGMAPLQQERENEAIAKMSQIIQLANEDGNSGDDSDDVVFYIPDNQRPVVGD